MTCLLEKAGTPFAPVGTRVTSRDCSKIDVLWELPPLQSGSPIITEFRVEVKEASGAEQNYTGLQNVKDYTITGLEAEKNYTVQVFAKNSRGYGTPSPPNTIRTDPEGRGPVFPKLKITVLSLAC